MPADLIREEIRKRGVISFARFMDIALYCPETGYYETNKDSVGARGDFITSVSAGSLFGELLAVQFAEWLQGLSADSRLRIIEAGAHGGQLAGDILAWLRAHRRELFDRLEYFVIEPSARRRGWQEQALEKFSGQVRWVAELAELKQRPTAAAAIFFSNELLDAFPVRRHGWSAAEQRWFEWGVVLAGENFRWERMPAVSQPGSDVRSDLVSLPTALANLPSALLAVLPDGYTIETGSAAEAWWREASGSFQQGRLMTIDYGFTAEEMISPARVHGTLRAYHRHHVTDDVLAHPGEQDLTAHVNFTAMQGAGEAAGLRTEQFCTQPQFLTRILQTAVARGTFSHWDARQVRQFQTLTHPEHLGRAFRVLVQSR